MHARAHAALRVRACAGRLCAAAPRPRFPSSVCASDLFAEVGARDGSSGRVGTGSGRVRAVCSQGRTSFHWKDCPAPVRNRPRSVFPVERLEGLPSEHQEEQRRRDRTKGKGAEAQRRNEGREGGRSSTQRQRAGGERAWADGLWPRASPFSSSFAAHAVDAVSVRSGGVSSKPCAAYCGSSSACRSWSPRDPFP